MPVQHTSLLQEKVSDAAREQNKLRFKHISFHYGETWVKEIDFLTAPYMYYAYMFRLCSYKLFV